MSFFDNLKKKIGKEISKPVQEEDSISDLNKKEMQEIGTEKASDKPDMNDFRHLEDLIKSNREIILTSDIILSEGEESVFPEGIEIKGDGITIDGAGFMIDAKQKTRFFRITGKNILLKNIAFKNGLEVEGGSGIVNDGVLEIQNCSFSGCWSLQTGGVIENHGEVNLSDCDFEDNITRSEGGVIHNSSIIHISKSQFYKNKSHFGAVIINHGEASFNDCSIRENVCNLTEGTLSNHGELKIIGCEIIENKASNAMGGAISNGGKALVENCLITGNNAKSGSALFNSGTAKISQCQILNGESVFNQDGELRIERSVIVENILEEGSLLHNLRGSMRVLSSKITGNKCPMELIVNNDSLEIYSSVFEYNEAECIISNDGEGDSNLSLENANFQENRVGRATILNNGKSFAMIYSTVEDDSDTISLHSLTDATLKKTSISGKIINDGTMTVKNMGKEFSNRISGTGKVVETFTPPSICNFSFLDEEIQESSSKTITLENDFEFESFEKEFFEGGVELDIDGLTIDGKNHVIDGKDGSRIFTITGDNITLKNIIFKNGSSHKDYDGIINSNGGALLINGACNVNIENCEFIDNASQTNGGAIYSKGHLNISKCIFKGNSSNIQGGAVFNEGELCLHDCSIECNESYNGGGAIFNLSKASIRECIFRGNFADVASRKQNPHSSQQYFYAISYGGAINNYDELEIIDTIFESNWANDAGGAITNNEKSRLTIRKCEFKANTSRISHGGAIANAGTLIIIESGFENNSTEQCGGAIANLEYGDMNISDSVFSKNEAYSEEVAGGGGAILASGDNAVIKRTVFSKNKSYYKGGGIFLNNPPLKIEECTFEDNESVTGDADIYNNTDYEIPQDPSGNI